MEERGSCEPFVEMTIAPEAKRPEFSISSMSIPTALDHTTGSLNHSSDFHESICTPPEFELYHVSASLRLWGSTRMVFGPALYLPPAVHAFDSTGLEPCKHRCKLRGRLLLATPFAAWPA